MSIESRLNEVTSVYALKMAVIYRNAIRAICSRAFAKLIETRARRTSVIKEIVEIRNSRRECLVETEIISKFREERKLTPSAIVRNNINSRRRRISFFFSSL